MEIKSVWGKAYLYIETAEEFKSYAIENYKDHDHFMCDHCYLTWKGPGWYTFYEDNEYGDWHGHHMNCDTSVHIRQNLQAEIEVLKTHIKDLEALERS